MNSEKTTTYKFIGIIHSPFKEPKGTPIQPPASGGNKGKIEIFKEYLPGLEDLDGFSHILVLYHFHQIRKAALKVKPFMDDQKHGVFSTRAPNRPNAIGISIVQLNRIEGNMLFVEDLDMIDQTPVLDIKPYVPEFDHREAQKIGWLEKNIHNLSSRKDDGRFT